MHLESMELVQDNSVMLRMSGDVHLACIMTPNLRLTLLCV